MVNVPLNSGVNFPANAATLNSFLASIVSFDFLKQVNDEIDERFYEDLNDAEPLNIHFEQLGYESTEFVRSADSVILNIYLHLVFTLVVVIFMKCSRIFTKLYGLLIWNGHIRLILEIYFELLLTSTISLK